MYIHRRKRNSFSHGHSFLSTWACKFRPSCISVQCFDCIRVQGKVKKEPLYYRTNQFVLVIQVLYATQKAAKVINHASNTLHSFCKAPLNFFHVPVKRKARLRCDLQVQLFKDQQKFDTRTTQFHHTRSY